MPRFQRGSRPPDVAAWPWGDQHFGVTRLEWRDATNDLMHPVRDRAEGVVIEARHLAGLMVPSGSINPTAPRSLSLPS